GMRPSAISQNGLSARSTKRIALRITGHLWQREPRRIGDGRKVVSIACCDLMNPSRKNGNTPPKSCTRWSRRAFRGLAIPVSIQRLKNLASDTDALQFPKIWRGQSVSISAWRLIRQGLVQFCRRFYYLRL